MAFSQATIEDVAVGRDVDDWRISWVDSTSPAGTVYQVYADLKLKWSGKAKSVVLPLAGFLRIDVGTVAPGEDTTDFSASLVAAPESASRVLLTWDGGDWESRALPIEGFHVYASSAPGAAVDYATILATIPEAVQGIQPGGWGAGGWGSGGWGAGLAAYSWTTGRLCPGDWSFAVVPFDTAGTEGDPSLEVTATVTAAPRAPAPNPAGRRLTYDSYHTAGGHAFATLHWLASPAC